MKMDCTQSSHSQTQQIGGNQQPFRNSHAWCWGIIS